ncbi:hypothetical protein SAMN02990966_03673 [Rhodospirillales bacterium URHD0017]|nr:hypothetical protein SAMN02990966_03673 [Rhodospirillales bacterium URHD0017]
MSKKKESTTKVTPIRFDPVLRHGLEMLGRTLRTPMNKLVNQAVDDFLKRRTAEVETDLTALLNDIKAYRKQDPDFEKVIRQTAQSEALAVRKRIQDPAEGHRLHRTKRDRAASSKRRTAGRG